mmetsp:Transcript_21050/g.68125  ORF Transcript_21050/g.68125 Transcript_21050/m.68125 type:complete len:202 (+) Transcript_21050:537-1142(+)
MQSPLPLPVPVANAPMSCMTIPLEAAVAQRHRLVPAVALVVCWRCVTIHACPRPVIVGLDETDALHADDFFGDGVDPVVRQFPRRSRRANLAEVERPRREPVAVVGRHPLSDERPSAPFEIHVAKRLARALALHRTQRVPSALGVGFVVEDFLARGVLAHRLFRFACVAEPRLVTLALALAQVHAFAVAQRRAGDVRHVFL